jgi:CMP-N-acetylneuraminic acid synthetase
LTEYKDNINTTAKIPKITVYITNHNYGQFIEKSIENVLNQTLQDFELIIIDDGSTDNSRSIIEKYAEHEKVLVIFQQNKGLNITNNIALRKARGDYIMRLDADDYLDENALAVLSGVLDRNPDIGLVFPDYFVINESEDVIEIMRRHDFNKVTLLDQPAHGACSLIRRKCLLEIGGYDESFRCQDGYDLWVRFVQEYKVENVNLPLFYYRQHSGNLTRNEERILSTRSKIVHKFTAKNGTKLNVLAVIPVRGDIVEPGSRPMQLLGNIPLIDWTINAALGAKKVQDVLVTTPDDGVLAYADERFGGRVIPVKREKKLAKLNTFIIDTIQHAYNEYTRTNKEPDVIVVLYVYSPFRGAEHIDHAIEMMELYDTDTVVSGRPDNDVFFQHNGTSLELVRKKNTLRLEREDLFREVGHMHVVKTSFLKKDQKLTGGKIGHVVLDPIASMSVMTDHEWRIAELVVSSKMVSNGVPE